MLKLDEEKQSDERAQTSCPALGPPKLPLAQIHPSALDPHLNNLSLIVIALSFRKSTQTLSSFGDPSTCFLSAKHTGDAALELEVLINPFSNISLMYFLR